jgi:hypothetical protein
MYPAIRLYPHVELLSAILRIIASHSAGIGLGSALLPPMTIVFSSNFLAVPSQNSGWLENVSDILKNPPIKPYGFGGKSFALLLVQTKPFPFQLFFQRFAENVIFFYTVVHTLYQSN